MAVTEAKKESIYYQLRVPVFPTALQLGVMVLSKMHKELNRIEVLKPRVDDVLGRQDCLEIIQDVESGKVLRVEIGNRRNKYFIDDNRFKSTVFERLFRYDFLAKCTYS